VAETATFYARALLAIKRACRQHGFVFYVKKENLVAQHLVGFANKKHTSFVYVYLPH
jgi:hypothetical protein